MRCHSVSKKSWKFPIPKSRKPNKAVETNCQLCDPTPHSTFKLFFSEKRAVMPVENEKKE